jgi:hypothetical protein
LFEKYNGIGIDFLAVVRAGKSVQWAVAVKQ